MYRSVLIKPTLLKTTGWIFGLSALLAFSATIAHSSATAPKDITLEIVDQPMLPLVTAKLTQIDQTLVIRGEIRKRGDATLNGYISIHAIASDGKTLWDKKAELLPSGLRYFRYRNFEDTATSLPPAGSKVIIQFHPPSSASAIDFMSAIDLWNEKTSRPLVL